MKKTTLLSYVLEDDNTETGGTSKANETLYDFLCELGLLDKGYTIEKINHLLKECGIKPINKRKLLNGWQVAVDLCYNDRENKNLFNSPVFKKEDTAYSWYQKLDFNTTQYKEISDGIDFVMLHYTNGEIDDTYII